MGQEDGAEPNAGHAAVAPTALLGLKITMFTQSQSWDLCLPVRRGSGPRCVHITQAHLPLGLGGTWSNAGEDQGFLGLLPWVILGGGR